MNPVCPPRYTCTFTPPKTVYAHWWDGPAGTYVAVFVTILMFAVLIALIYYVTLNLRKRADRKLGAREREAERKQKLALAEQRTLLADACKGNPEMIKVVMEQMR
jgi:hypothetical protein